MCGPGSNPGVDAIKGCVCCLFFPLFREIFLWVLRFSALIKSQRFQIPIRPWMAEEESVCGCATSKSFFTSSKLLFIYLFIYSFIYLFIYLFTFLLPAAGKCDWNRGTSTYIHDKCPPDWERCHSTTTTAHFQLTTVVVARSSSSSLFYSFHFWDQWRRDVIYFNFLSSQKYLIECYSI